MSDNEEQLVNGTAEGESPPAEESDAMVEKGPHAVCIRKSSQGFGFNVRGQITEGGQLKSIQGELYAPMQYISAVLEAGPGEKAGLKVGDRILQVNGQSVEGVDHQTVVQLIRQSGSEVNMVVISVNDEDARRLEPDNSPGNSSMDYYERRTVPISVPDTKKMTDETGKEFISFNIYLGGKCTSSRRYREFDALSSSLKRQFGDFIFPRLPGKRPFALNDTQVDSRRRGLEDYLEKVCSARVIFESDLMQDFLQLKKSGTSGSRPAGQIPVTGRATAAPVEKEVQLRVLLPDKTISMVTIQQFWRTEEVYQTLASKIGLKTSAMKYFALFERTEDGFDRKLQKSEFPHQIYIQKYSSSSPNDSCIVLRKWIFTRTQEVQASSDPVVLNLLYDQAVDDIGKGRIPCEDKLAELRSLKSQGKKEEFLDLARSLPAYHTVFFPHCPCDARKVGHVKVGVNLHQFTLQACTTEGEDEAQSPAFTWDQITNYEADIDESAFTFRYTREGKDPRWVKIFTPYFHYLEECVDRINEEMKQWKQHNSVSSTTTKSTSSSSKPLASTITNDDL